MKKMIRYISLCLVVVMIMSMMAACSGNDKFVGTWEEIDSDGDPTGTVLVLANDGTGSIKEDGLSGSVNWSVEKNKLFVTLSLCGMSDTGEYSYKFSGNKMIWTDVDGGEIIYQKVGK